MMREFEIERQFQIKIDIIKANKGIYYIKTNKGERCLKKINYGPQKLLFVYGAKEHLIKNGFKNVDKYFLNIDGEPYALVNEDLYTLSEFVGENGDVVDPYGGTLAEYEACFTELVRLVKKTVYKINEK